MGDHRSRQRVRRHTVRAACARIGVKQSMGRPGWALDNAVIEAWHSTLEFELRRVERYATKVEARIGVAAFINEYHRDRRHTSIGMMSPLDYELSLTADQQPAA